MRRRQRRLRSWWRHEQRSVAAALAAATHHSAPRSGWPVQHDAPRGPTTASAMEGEVREVYEVPREQKPPLPGMRPAPLSEVAGPLGRLVATACPSGGVPALVPVVMVQEAAHDDATVSYLLSQTLLAEQEAKEVEELEAKLADREHRLMTSIRELRGRHDLRDQFTRLEKQVIGWAGIKWEVEKKKEKKRKRKKRRKRKTPKTSSSRGRRHRRLGQWHVPGWSFWCCSSRCVRVVGIGSGMCWLVLLVTLHLALCSSSLLSMSVAVPQVQFLDKVFFPFLFRLVLLVIRCRKLWRFRSCRLSTSSFRFLSWCRGRFPWSFSGPRCSCINAGMDHKEFSRPSSMSFTCPLCATTGASLWCSRQCRRSSRTCCPCPCCATTRAHGARDSAGAVHSSICGAHRDVVHSPLDGCIIVALLLSCPCTLRRQTARSVAPCCCESVCVAMSCGGGFPPDGAYVSVWDSGKPLTGNYFFNYFQYQVFVGCVCLLNYWFSSNDEFAQSSTTFPGES